MSRARCGSSTTWRPRPRIRPYGRPRRPSPRGSGRAQPGRHPPRPAELHAGVPQNRVRVKSDANPSDALRHTSGMALDTLPPTPNMHANGHGARLGVAARRLPRHPAARLPPEGGGVCTPRHPAPGGCARLAQRAGTVPSCPREALPRHRCPRSLPGEPAGLPHPPPGHGLGSDGRRRRPRLRASSRLPSTGTGRPPVGTRRAGAARSGRRTRGARLRGCRTGRGGSSFSTWTAP